MDLGSLPSTGGFQTTFLRAVTFQKIKRLSRKLKKHLGNPSASSDREPYLPGNGHIGLKTVDTHGEKLFSSRRCQQKQILLSDRLDLSRITKLSQPKWHTHPDLNPSAGPRRVASLCLRAQMPRSFPYRKSVKRERRSPYPELPSVWVNRFVVYPHDDVSRTSAGKSR